MKERPKGQANTGQALRTYFLDELAKQKRGQADRKMTVRLDINTGHAGKASNKQKIRELFSTCSKGRKVNDTESTGRLSLLSRQEEWQQAGRRACLLKEDRQEVQDKRWSSFRNSNHSKGSDGKIRQEGKQAGQACKIGKKEREAKLIGNR
jgi:hypothetical protein